MKNLLLKLIRALEAFELKEDDAQINILEKFRMLPGVDVIIENREEQANVKRLH